MTAKEKYYNWMQKRADNAADPKNTFWHRVTVKVLSTLILSVLSFALYFIVDVRDNMKKIPKQEKDINYLKRSEDYNRQKWSLILLNDKQLGKIETDHLQRIFYELDNRSDELYKKND